MKSSESVTCTLTAPQLQVPSILEKVRFDSEISFQSKTVRENENNQRTSLESNGNSDVGYAGSMTPEVS